jgi:hypothetical protein
MANPALKRYEFTALKDKSGTDKAQVPTAATIDFYRQGASIPPGCGFSFTQVLEEAEMVRVDDPGDIQSGDTLAVFHGGLSTNQLTVDSLAFDEQTGRMQLMVFNDGPISAIPGDRLIVWNDRPQCFADPIGTGSGTSSICSDLYPATQGGFDHPIIIADHGLQAAVDFCPAGGTVFIPRGEYTVPSGGLVINKPLILRGEPGTTLFAHACYTDEAVIRIVPGGNQLRNIQIRDLTLQNPGNHPPAIVPGNYGICCDVPTDGSKVSWVVLENLVVEGMGDDNLHFDANGTNDSYIVFLTLRNVQSSWSRGHGAFIKVANNVSAYDCYFNASDLCGVWADTSEVQFLGCGFEDNCHSDADSGYHASPSTSVCARLPDQPIRWVPFRELRDQQPAW